MPFENFFTRTSAQSESRTRSSSSGARLASVAPSTPDIWPKIESVWRAVR